MTEILIIRSASIQQLDLNLPAIKARFNDCELSVLTHEHAVESVRKYSDIAAVYVYCHKSGFRFWRKAIEISNRSFGAVTVQTANLSGSGYLNVLLFALTVPAKKIYICNHLSEITEIKKHTVLFRVLLTAAFKTVAAALTIPIAAALLFISLPRVIYSFRSL